MYETMSGDWVWYAGVLGVNDEDDKRGSLYADTTVLGLECCGFRVEDPNGVTDAAASCLTGIWIVLFCLSNFSKQSLQYELFLGI